MANGQQDAAWGGFDLLVVPVREVLEAFGAEPLLFLGYALWCYKTSHEVGFGITSLPRNTTTPMKLLEIRRAYWGIETGSHYRRDGTLKEDATRFTIGNGARVMANINNLILGLIRQAGFLNAPKARRFFTTHLSVAFSLLVTLSVTVVKVSRSSE